MPIRTRWNNILKWLVEFLIVCGSSRVFLEAVFLIHLFYPTAISESLLTWIYIGTIAVLIVLGIANLLQIQDMVYMRQGILNPAIARDSYQDFAKRGEQNRRIGLLLGLSGLALLFGFAPSFLLFPIYFLNSLVAIFAGEVFLLILFLIVYGKMQRRNHATSATNNTT